MGEGGLQGGGPEQGDQQVMLPGQEPPHQEPQHGGPEQGNQEVLLHGVPLSPAAHTFLQHREQSLLWEARLGMAKLARKRAADTDTADPESILPSDVEAVLGGDLAEWLTPDKRRRAQAALRALPRSGEFLQSLLLVLLGGGLSAIVATVMTGPKWGVWVSAGASLLALLGAAYVWRRRRV